MSCKRFILVVAMIGLPGFAYTAERPMPAAPGETGSVGAPMRGDDHMNGPLHRRMVTVFLLPEMQTELGLTAQQLSQMRGLRKDLVAKSRDIANQETARRKELDQLLSGDTSRTRAVKALFETLAELRAELQYSGFDTAYKMKALLNDAQRSKFDSMKPTDLHRLMMSRGDHEKMEETMQLMAEGDGMHMHDGL